MADDKEKEELKDRVKKAEDGLKTALDWIEERKAKDAEEEKAEKEAKDAEEKAEREEKEAKDAEEKERMEKEAKDKAARDSETEEEKKKREEKEKAEKSEKKEGMDAAEVKKLVATSVAAALAQNNPKEYMKRIRQGNELAEKLSPFVGTFDHSEMTPDEIAKYGVDKLKIACDSGHELAALNGYLHNRVATRTSVIALDSGERSGEVNDYLNKISA